MNKESQDRFEEYINSLDIPEYYKSMILLKHYVKINEEKMKINRIMANSLLNEVDHKGDQI